ncbi:MAG: hypothetical protein ACI9NC_005581, partial [Verrucomicrobiales bacterium]
MLILALRTLHVGKFLIFIGTSSPGSSRRYQNW